MKSLTSKAQNIKTCCCFSIYFKFSFKEYSTLKLVKNMHIERKSWRIAKMIPRDKNNNEG